MRVGKPPEISQIFAGVPPLFVPNMSPRNVVSVEVGWRRERPIGVHHEDGQHIQGPGPGCVRIGVLTPGGPPARLTRSRYFACTNRRDRSDFDDFGSAGRRDVLRPNCEQPDLVRDFRRKRGRQRLRPAPAFAVFLKDSPGESIRKQRKQWERWTQPPDPSNAGSTTCGSGHAGVTAVRAAWQKTDWPLNLRLVLRPSRPRRNGSPFRHRSG